MLNKRYTLNLIQAEEAVWSLPQAHGTSEPSECEYGHADHREQEAVGLLFHKTHGAAASGADVVGDRSVGLRFVHGELVALPGSKVAR